MKNSSFVGEMYKKDNTKVLNAHVGNCIYFLGEMLFISLIYRCS
jgi:hypothetical protein